MRDIPAGSLQRQSGYIQDQALKEPIGITRNGRRRLVMLSVEAYERLKRRDREVVRPEELDTAEVDAIAAAEPAGEAAAYDNELTDAPS